MEINFTNSTNATANKVYTETKAERITIDKYIPNCFLLVILLNTEGFKIKL